MDISRGNHFIFVTLPLRPTIVPRTMSRIVHSAIYYVDNPASVLKVQLSVPLRVERFKQTGFQCCLVDAATYEDELCLLTARFARIRCLVSIVYVADALSKKKPTVLCGNTSFEAMNFEGLVRCVVGQHFLPKYCAQKIIKLIDLSCAQCGKCYCGCGD